MPLVRNRKPGPTILDDRNADVVISWEGAGHARGEDVQEVPEALMKNAGLVRAVRKGVLEIVPEDEVIATHFARQATDYEKAVQDQHDAVMETLEPSSRDLDLIETKCLISGQDIIMSERDMREHPPLADEFKDRESEFVAHETGQLNEQGKPVVTWVRVTVGDALPSQQGD